MPFLGWDSVISSYGAVVVALIIILCTLLYINHMSHFQYWKKRGIPEISRKASPIVGHTGPVVLGKISFNDLFLKLYEESEGKKFAGYYQGTRPFLLVNDPEMIRSILVRDFPVFVNRGFEIDEAIDPLNGRALTNLKDQRWKDMRSRLSPTFTSGRMKAMFPMMKSCADIMVEHIAQEIQNNSGCGTIEVKELFSCFTTDVIASCAFGVQSDSLRNPETSEFRKMGKEVFRPTIKRTIAVMLFFAAPKLTGRFGIKFNSTETEFFFRNFVENVVKAREDILEKGGDINKFGDFIQILVLLKKYGIHAIKEKDDSFLSEIESQHYSAPEKVSWSDMTLDDLTAQVLIFFTAGFETTAALLTYALYELTCSENGIEVQTTLREKILSAIKENGGIINYDLIQRIPLLDHVLSETLRLHPATGALTRVCSEQYTLPGTDITLEKGTAIAISVNGLQLDSRYFENPTKFDPSRFSPEKKGDRSNYVYLPFGEGPRMCVGQRFSQMQARLGLAVLMSKFKFELSTEKTQLPLRVNPRGFSTTPVGGIWIKFTEIS
ncbi:cytochrome P450 6a2-like [Ischnura elegans]|uniref:cytochrome P450 6a2-like n=1 Tax=Ischnura elegans TaxID=197161 RepID=UPI001ED8B7D3|nr:cytochrome P450 6a2-like [Ischnura elegans]